MKRFLKLLSGASAAVFALSLAIAPAQVSAQTASVRVVHGIPGRDVSPALDPALPVDVLVADSICLLSGFSFGDIAGPFTLPEGSFNVKVSLANTLEPCSGDPVIDADVPFEAGENASIVAHLTDGGAPTASKFLNDVSAPADSNARIIAHHVANAPVVDLLVRGGFPSNTLLLVPGVGNIPGANQAAAELRGTQAQLSILPAGTNDSVFLRIFQARPGQVYTAYAVGSLANGTFTVIVEPIGGLKGIDVRF